MRSRNTTSTDSQEAGVILPLDFGAVDTRMALIEELCNPLLLQKCWKRIYWSKSISKKSRSKGIDNQSIQDFKTNEELFLKEISEEVFYDLLPRR